MPKHIRDQGSMNAAKRAVAFCYICGGSLKGSEPLGVDHVVPYALLGPPPSNMSGRWPITLPVHQRCDREKKSRDDDFIAIVHRVMTKGESEWSPSDKVVLRRHLDMQTRGEVDGLVPGFKADAGFRAAWTWIRGLHTVLYNERLLPDTKHRVLAPVPGYAEGLSEPLENQLARDEQVGRIIARGLAAGVSGDSCDGVVAWGGKVIYQCVWIQPDGNSGGWLCVWSLVYPGVFKWSASVRKVPVPWRGAYRSRELPPGATVLDEAGIPAGEEMIRRQEYEEAHPFPASAMWLPTTRRRR